MANVVDMGFQMAGQAMRFGWYFGLNRLVDWRTSQNDAPQPSVKATRPVPTRQEILTDLAQLLMRDAAAVRQGLMPPLTDGNMPLEALRRARSMLLDLPSSAHRRMAHDAGSAREMADTEGLPAYFVQDFHFQTGGYLTEESARLYDVQVETLFLGGAAPMRREALRPIAEFMRGRDQRRVTLLDVACGTGRFLRDARLAWPAMTLTGLDLSQAYLDEAGRHLSRLRPVSLIAANAETMPLPDASQDIVATIFLFHELPPEVRRRVAAEMARVLKPGGLLVFIDSLQMGDRPAWDGLLETFPVRFHEPYYRHYATDNLDTLFNAAGLQAQSSVTSYFSKVMVRRKLGS